MPRKAAETRERPTDARSCEPNEAQCTSAEKVGPSVSTGRRPAEALDKADAELIVDALRDRIHAGETNRPPAPAQRVRLKHIKRVVDRRGVVRIYFVRGGKPHIRLDAPEGTPAFFEAYETARREKALQSKAHRRPSAPRRSMSDLVDLYQRTEVYARFLPQTQPVYDRVMRRLLHVEQLAGCNAASVGRQRIQQLVDRHAGSPAAAADLLKKLRILFRCAIKHGWRSHDPTRGVRVGESGVAVSRQQS